MSTPILRDGWLMVPYRGPELARIELAIGTIDNWRPAFLDWHDGERVAKIRHLAATGTVWLAINGDARRVGVLAGIGPLRGGSSGRATVR